MTVQVHHCWFTIAGSPTQYGKPKDSDPTSVHEVIAYVPVSTFSTTVLIAYT